MISANELIRVIKSLVSHPIGKIVYHLSGLVRRDPDIWVFGAQKNIFYCNPKYLYLAASERKEPGQTCVWISRDRNLCVELRARGLSAEYLFSPRGAMYCLRAGFYFINCELKDISFNLSKGCVVTNLWHGIPLKKIQFDNLRNQKTELRLKRQTGESWFDRIFNPADMRGFDYVLSTSDYVTDYAFSSAFNVSKYRCLPFGYPRADILFRGESDVMAHILAHEGGQALDMANWLRKFDRRIVYMPTWRDTRGDFVRESGLDFDDLDRKLHDLNACFVLKLHPNTKIDLNVLERFKNIKVVNHRVDIYPLLPLTDALVTDYSSIYFDYLLLNKPVVFFCPDYEVYVSECRDLYLDYEEVTPGPKVRTYAELMRVIFDPELESNWREARFNVRQMFWGDYSGDASSKLIDFMQGLRKK